jgi:hypothetical protein
MSYFNLVCTYLNHTQTDITDYYLPIKTLNMIFFCLVVGILNLHFTMVYKLEIITVLTRDEPQIT